MTLRLILTRHAKSDWNDPLQDDFDRPLNARGQTSARAIGEWLEKKGYVPDHILCSSAERTGETCALIMEAWAAKPETLYLKELYLAAPQTMLDILKSKAKGQTAMMIAHNPGTATMAGMLARRAPQHPDFGRYPTAFTTIIDFDLDEWSEVDWGRGNASDAIAARDLI